MMPPNLPDLTILFWVFVVACALAAWKLGEGVMWLFTHLRWVSP